MNGEQGKLMAFTGDFKSQYGKGTDDDWQQIEGQDNENVGNVQERNCEKIRTDESGRISGIIRRRRTSQRKDALTGRAGVSVANLCSPAGTSSIAR